MTNIAYFAVAIIQVCFKCQLLQKLSIESNIPMKSHTSPNTALKNASIFRSSNLQSVRTPEHTSTPKGWTISMASLTFSPFNPPVRKTGTLDRVGIHFPMVVCDTATGGFRGQRIKNFAKRNNPPPTKTIDVSVFSLFS